MEYKLKEIKIEVTHQCPLSCVHCSSNANPDNNLALDLDKCIQIVDEAKKLGLEEIAISGGEPLIWPALVNLVNHTKKLDLCTTIYTSGNGPDAPTVLRQLAHERLDKAVFSVYSNIEKDHNVVTRRNDSFANTIQAIELANALNIATEIHFVALASNYSKLPDIVDFAKNHGVKRISVLRFVPQGRGRFIQDKDTLDKEQNNELSKLIKKIQDSGFDLRTGSPLNIYGVNKEPKCLAAQDRLIILPDLTIYPCDAFKQITAHDITGLEFDKDLNSASLEDCWINSQYLNQVRTAIKQPLKGKCSTCQNNMLCLSGCLAQKFLKYGNLAPNRDPACLY